MNLDKDIGHFPNAIPSNLCDHLINLFNIYDSLGLVFDRGEHESYKGLAKKDRTAFILNHIDKAVDPTSPILYEFFQIFWRHFRVYADQYPALATDSDKLQIRCARLQETHPGGGYHVWHYESDSIESRQKVVVWSVYLNTVDEGGETEFLHQHKRYNPIQGDLLFWPAGFTHTHRGNPPLSGEKFLLTGWIEY
jgi:hypothetical protein